MAGPEGHVGRLKVAFYHFCAGLPLAASVMLYPQCMSLFRVQLFYLMCVFKKSGMILVLYKRVYSTAARTAVLLMHRCVEITAEQDVQDVCCVLETSQTFSAKTKRHQAAFGLGFCLYPVIN